MAINLSEIRAQLAPSWTPVNIGILVVFFLISTFLGILWLGYILGGRYIGLDLSQSGSVQSTFEKAKRSGKAAMASFKNDDDTVVETTTRDTHDTNFSSGGGKPAHDGTVKTDSSWERNEMDKLAQARAELAKEKAAFEAEKAAFKNSDSVK